MPYRDPPPAKPAPQPRAPLPPLSAWERLRALWSARGIDRSGDFHMRHPDLALARIAALSPRFEAVRKLWVSSADLQEEVLLTLFQSTHWNQLKELTVLRLREMPSLWTETLPGIPFETGPRVGYLGRAVAEAGLHKLERLDFHLCALGDEGVAALGASQTFGAARVEHVTLYGAAVGDAGIVALAAGTWPQRLTSLTLCYNPLGCRALQALATLPELKRLDLTGSPVGDEEIEALASQPWPSLEHLCLAKSALTAASGALLVSARSKFPALGTLHLWDTALQKDDKVLIDSGWLVWSQYYGSKPGYYVVRRD